MAISTDQFDAGMLDYVAVLNALIVSINTEITLQVPRAGLTDNLPASGYRITGAADSVNAQDLATRQDVISLAGGASTPFNDPGDAGKYWSVNDAGSAVIWRALLNENDMATDSVKIPPTQQSVRTFGETLDTIKTFMLVS